MTSNGRGPIPTFLGEFGQELAALRATGHFSAEWLVDDSHKRGGWLHARLWAAMVRAVLLHMPGASWGRLFKPDLLICGPDDTPELVVELEPTNSSDGRVVQRDIDRLRYLARRPEPEVPPVAMPPPAR